MFCKLASSSIFFLLIANNSYSAVSYSNEAHKFCLSKNGTYEYNSKHDYWFCNNESSSNKYISGNAVYSETNSHQTTINQKNSNNTHIDNSKTLSDNSFSLFSSSGKTYSVYMGYEPILYLDASVTGTFGGITQVYAGG